MLYIFITFSLLAAGITVNKYILYFLTPAWFVAIRMSLAGLILVLYNFRQFTPEFRHRVKQDWWGLFMIALCTTLIPSLLKAFGLKYMFAAKSTLLSSIDPFVTSIYAYFLWNERLNLRKVLGILLGCFGVLIIAKSQAPEELSWQAFSFLSYPELAVLLAVVVSRHGWIQAQKLLKEERYTPTQINGLVMVISGLGAFILAAIDGKPLIGDFCPSWMTLLIWISSIVAANVIGYAMYARCLKDHSSTLVSLAGFLIPILVASFAYLTLGEPFSMDFALASIAILAGLVLFSFDFYKDKPNLTQDKK